MGFRDGAGRRAGRIDGFDRQRAIIPGDADHFFFRTVGAMDGVFWGMQEGARPVLDISFDPFSLENDHRFGGLGVAMSGNHCTGSKLS